MLLQTENCNKKNSSVYKEMNNIDPTQNDVQ